MISTEMGCSPLPKMALNKEKLRLWVFQGYEKKY